MHWVSLNTPNLPLHLQLLKEENYNKFFNPNVCHVCKMANDTSLMTCDECGMISYCDNSHKLIHEKKHKEICGYLKEYLTTQVNCGINHEHITWVHSRQEFLSSIKRWLPRKLEPYEEQMILFAKSCYSCHKQDFLLSCLECYCENYCNKHAQDFQSQHKSKCKKFMLSSNLDVICNVFSFDKDLVKFFSEEKTNETFNVDNMKIFIDRYIRRTTSANRSIWSPDHYFYSDCLSGPLTLYYAMMDANLIRLMIQKPKCVIHIVVSNILDVEYLPAWEFFLHLSPNFIKVCSIVLVGTQLKEKSGVMDVCRTCQLRLNQLNYEFCSKSYRDYMKSSSYEEPNVIVGFQANIRDEETWTNLMFLFQFRNCPLLLTTTSIYKTKENIDEIQDVLNINVTPLYDKENKFRSYRPWKDVESGYVYFRNDHVSIYPKL